MTTGRYYILLSVLTAVLLTGCHDDNGLVQSADEHVVADMVFAVSAAPNVGLTRMASDVVQANANYRGITNVSIIPFTVDPTVNRVVSNSTPKLFVVSGDGAQLSERLYYYSHCTFMTGTNAVLFYGKAPAATGASKAENGSLIANFPPRMNPQGITFSPEAIFGDDSIPEDAQTLADYMTEIANTEGWSASTQDNGAGLALWELYNQFIGNNGQNISLLSGARANIVAHVNMLNTQLESFNNTGVAAAIRHKLNTTPVPDIDYPHTTGLPDGAAVLRWSVTDKRFEVQTQRTNLVDINSIQRFAYPAELYYFANSRLWTTYYEVPLDVYSNTKQLPWAELMGTDSIRFTEHAVSGDTKSVAIQQPVQYGVACMKLQLNRVPAELLDNHNVAVSMGRVDDKKFPLTGVIVNGQRKVDFDFDPVADQEEDDYFVYDGAISGAYLSSSVMDPVPVYTLLLESYGGQKVTLLLEFRNDSGQDFFGRDGIIYEGTKFYLAGTIDPTNREQTMSNPRGSAFTKDEITIVNVTVESLANAYHVMPNLLSPRLEVGIQLNPDWQALTPLSVPMF